MQIIRSALLSKHSLAWALRFGVAADHLGGACSIPGNPFAGSIVLSPNHPSMQKPYVTFGPFELPSDLDTISCLVSGLRPPEHQNVVGVTVAVLDERGAVTREGALCIEHGESKPLTLRLDAAGCRTIALRFAVSFRQFVEEVPHGAVEIRNLAAYRWNPLVGLLNETRSDKGTEWASGNRGAAHCYALEYYRLLGSLQGREFKLLEIGLDDASKTTGTPNDAPSLKAWRQFFRKAKLHGYDINDFSFFQQERTTTFQGDQASRADLRRFLDSAGEPGFRVILDDGSHASSHQQISLATLFPSVEPGGMYIIEDLGWQPFAETPKTLELLQQFWRTGKIESPFIEPAEARYLEETIDRVEIYKPNDSEFAVIHKKG